MGHRCFDVSVTGQVAHVVLKRGDELNTMVPEFWSELPAIVNGLSADGTTRVLVISSTGRHFSAGMDLSVFTSSALSAHQGAEPGRRHAHVRQAAKLLQETFTCLERARFPVIAAVHGGCIGGALDLAAACDLRYCTADAFFVLQEINIGMTADVGSLQRLPKIVPDGIVRELAYTGRRMPAARAREVGLVNDVFETRDEMISTVMAVARQIAGKSPLAVWGSKEMLNYARDHSVAEGLDYVATWQAGMFQPADLMASFHARSEQRDPEDEDLLPDPEGL